MNLVLITSVLNISKNPLSYSNTRSVFTCDERFEQTKKTIESIRKNIPNSKIFFVECSDLDKEKEEYLKNNSDIFYNLYKKDNEKIIEKTTHHSKALGEGTMTIEAIKYLEENNIDYENFYKITGRYHLTQNFDYNFFDENLNVAKIINYDNISVATSFYKLKNIYTNKLKKFLMNSEIEMLNCIAYETLIKNFLNTIDNNTFISPDNKIGIYCFNSCFGDHFEY